jgi:hypothetical protein
MRSSSPFTRFRGALLDVQILRRAAVALPRRALLHPCATALRSPTTWSASDIVTATGGDAMNVAELRKCLMGLELPALERIVQMLIKNYIDRHPEAAVALQSAEIMSSGLQEAADDAGFPAAAIAEPADKLDALRATTLQLADDSEHAELLAGALVAARPTRVDPVTSSIVLASIVLVLSTRFDVRYDNLDGKRRLRVQIGKEPTSQTLLTKLFGLFR